MPAKSTTSRAGERRPSQELEADPFNVDMSEVPMTPAMTSLHDAAKLRQLLRIAEQFLDNCVVDGSQLTLAEGQTMYFTMRAQGRPDTWRSQLTKLLLKRRGINLSARNWRSRTNRELNPEKVPSYMNAEMFDKLRAHIEPLAQLIEGAEDLRRKQFPALQKRTKAAIEAPLITAKAS
jgi:hypothetical protein